MKPLFLLLFVIGGAATVHAETVFTQNANTRTWPLARGLVEFTNRHPLTIIEGKIEKFEGVAHLNPKNLAEGLHLSIAGNTKDVLTDSGKLKAWIGEGKEWKFGSTAFLPRGGFTEEGQLPMDMVFNFRFGSRDTGEKMPVKCAVDASVLRCRFEGRFYSSHCGFTVPKLLFFPFNDDFEAHGEFVFSEPEGEK